MPGMKSGAATGFVVSVCPKRAVTEEATRFDFYNILTDFYSSALYS